MKRREPEPEPLTRIAFGLTWPAGRPFEPHLTGYRGRRIAGTAPAVPTATQAAPAPSWPAAADMEGF